MTEPEEERTGPPVAELVVVHGDGQYQGRNSKLNEVVSVRAYDDVRQVVSGARVEFTVRPGNGTVSNEWALTDSYGVASTWWTLGEVAGPHVMTASVADGPSVEITATARLGDFDIQVVAGKGFSDEQRSAMRAAAERWTAVIVGDKPDYSFPPNSQPTPWCQDLGLVPPAKIDDWRWDVIIVDVPGNYILSAPCHYRVGPTGMTEPLWSVLAISRLIVEEITRNVEPEALQAWFSHEVGRRLTTRIIHLVNKSTPGDVHFVDDATIAAFDAAGGADWNGGSKVPVESMVWRDQAWRCSVFGHEMLSGVFPSFTQRGRRPISAISVQLLAALDFEVDMSKADPYTLPETPWTNCFGERRSHPLADATIMFRHLPLRVPSH